MTLTTTPIPSPPSALNPHLNDDFPGRVPGTLTNAVVGRLESGVRLVDVIAHLGAGGVDPARIHALRGPDGEAFLTRVGNRFTRWFAEDHSQYLDLLRNGATLVAVLEVPTEQQDHTGVLLRRSGVRILRRYGSWTYHGR